MERIDLLVKTIVGVVSGFVSMLVGGLGLVFTVLLGLMAIDFITGLLAGAFNEGLQSRKGAKGIIKKVYVILLIGSVYLIETAVLKSNGVVTDGISGAFCLIEFVSITENGGRMGIQIPDKIKDLISTLKNEKKEGGDR
ncbi:phage holin family protein [Paenibacillus oleatilyticus]|uniref:phage holin family protein n=1 Tax=Paenibacillus oleatilyticus TaxID=2594886 RepID=UPI001C1FE3B2|nr:phage holin family protein [Paenibacillus oleatilyticus]MBU7316169.1 phage holin family protein [Paenibacillus oleatilyticus]